MRWGSSRTVRPRAASGVMRAVNATFENRSLRAICTASVGPASGAEDWAAGRRMCTPAPGGGASGVTV